MIQDRDTTFTTAFDAVFTADNLHLITSPVRAPRANAICERLIGTLRRELLDRLLVLNHAPLMTILHKYRSPYNRHRPHQPRAQRPPDIQAHPPPLPNLADHPIHRRPILSGLINEYECAA